MVELSGASAWNNSTRPSHLRPDPSDDFPRSGLWVADSSKHQYGFGIVWVLVVGEILPKTPSV